MRRPRLRLEHARVGLDPVSRCPRSTPARSCARYREWLPANGYEATNALAGSFVSDNIEDYYLNPWELGYGQFVKFDHDFIGREALEQIDADAQRKKVTLAWDGEDVARIFASLFETDEDPVPVLRPADRQLRLVELRLGARPRRQRASATRCSPATAPTSGGRCRWPRSTRRSRSAARSRVVWGEPNGGSRKTTVEPGTSRSGAGAGQPGAVLRAGPPVLRRGLEDRSEVAELGQPALEQAPLGVVVGERERAPVGARGLVGASEPAQQLAAGRVQVAVVLEQSRRSTMLEARLGPSASATATARLSSTTGEPVSRASSPYSAAICGQSRGSLGVQRGDRRLDHVRPVPARARARGRAPPAPRRSAPRSQSARSWSASSTSSPSRKRASRRASCSSISASRPCTSGSSGISSASARPSRSASAASVAAAARSPR